MSAEDRKPREIVGWMTWPDYQMMVNEAPEGGFQWEFLDFKPTAKDLKDFNTPIFIYTKKMSAEQSEIDRLRKQLVVAVECVSYYCNEQSWFKRPITEERNEAHSVEHLRIKAREALQEIQRIGGQE
jgi:hypothetical protein